MVVHVLHGAGRAHMKNFVSGAFRVVDYLGVAVVASHAPAVKIAPAECAVLNQLAGAASRILYNADVVDEKLTCIE